MKIVIIIFYKFFSHLFCSHKGLAKSAQPKAVDQYSLILEEEAAAAKAEENSSEEEPIIDPA